MGPSGVNNLTCPTQQYVSVKPSTDTTEVDLRLSKHHSRHHSTAELSRATASDEKGMQKGEVGVVRTTDDGKQGSEGHVPPAKSSKSVKAIRQPSPYQTHLVPGINTEKHPYDAGDGNEV